MRGPATLDDVIAGIRREAKTASVSAEPSARPELLRKLAEALRGTDGGSMVTYEDLYTVKEAACGR